MKRNQRKPLAKFLALACLLVMGWGSAWGQNQYVFLYKNGNTYNFLSHNVSGNTHSIGNVTVTNTANNFDAAKCVFILDGSKFYNANGATRYFQRNNNTLGLVDRSSNASNWSFSNYGKVYYDVTGFGATDRYIYYNNGWTALSQTNNPGNDTNYTVLFAYTEKDAAISQPVIAGASYIKATGTYDYSATATCSPEYEKFDGYSGTAEVSYYLYNDVMSTTEPTLGSEGITYTYNLTGYSGASVDGSGQITVSSLPSTPTKLRLTATASKTGYESVSVVREIWLLNSGATSATEENFGYAITSNNNNRWLGGSSTDNITAFNPSTCIWNGNSGGKFQNTAGYYLQYDDGLKMTNNSANASNWTLGTQQDGKTMYNSTSYRYLRYNSGWTTTSNSGNATRAVYIINKTTYFEQDENPAIGGDAVIAQLGDNASFHRTHVAVHQQEYVDYVFYSNSSHLFDMDGEPITTAPTATYTYAWSLENAGSYATINATTGVITYTNPVPSDQVVTVKLTATPNDGSGTKTATQTVTLKRPANPTNISVNANDLEIVVNENGTIHYYLTPDFNVYNNVVATAASGIVTITPSGSGASTGDFSVHGNAMGTVIVTLTAKKLDGSDACSTTVTVVVKEKCATPVINFQDNGDSALTTITCATPGATIYYTTDGTVPSSTNGHLYTGPFEVPGNTTVAAIAYCTGYYDSDIAYSTFAHSSGIFGKTVVLYDYEDHNWTYYSGVDANVDGGNYNTNYAGKIYSPNPRNVKVTYLGNGGEVSISEEQNTFIYYKTLESKGGQYTYQVISNPFSKRPTGMGFGGWKIISGGDKIQGHNNNDVLALDEEITFTNLTYTSVNCTSAEIVLQATWVDATIVRNTTSGLSSSGTYETNIIVLSQNYTNDIAPSYPCTIMMVEPDGSADYRGSYTFSGNITPNNSGVTKIENAKWNPGGNIAAGGKSLWIGRGVTCVTNTGRTVTLASGGTVDQVVKIESGTFSSLTHYSSAPSSLVKQYLILGCDYDRAANDNSKLTFTSTFIANRIDGGSGFNQEAFRTYSKSGSFMTSVSISNAAQTNSYYLSRYTTSGPGRSRYFEIEGGEWYANISGGQDNNGSTPTDKFAFTFRMKGGKVRGSIYGAAQQTNCVGNRLMVITGGEIGGWVAGAANGIQSGSGYLYGTTYVYFGGNAEIATKYQERNNHATTSIQNSIGGYVFGSGCGYSASSHAGEVTVSTNVVMADNASVEYGVYGGGAYGYSSGTANVYVTGGHVASTYDSQYSVFGGVYGGARQNDGGVANIYMTGGQIDGKTYNSNHGGGLFGGSNSSGDLSGAVKIVAVGGQVGTNTQNANIHGGGYGSSTSVAGNVDITLGDSNGNYPTVYGDVYGGSALGSVNNSTSNHTYITMNDGLIHGDIYGGGLGDNATAANVKGNVSVTVNKGVAENVFGCNNVNGKPSGTVAVTMTGGTINHSVYGGGNAAAYTGNPTVTISGGEVKENVFGAGLGSSAAVTGNTSVIISNAATKIGGSVFGGGSNGSVIGTATVSVADATVGGSVYGAGLGSGTNVSSTTSVSITGLANIAGNIYGGGDAGDVGGNTSVTINGNGLQVNDVFGAGKGTASNVGGTTNVTVDNGTVKGDVFGGAEEGTVKTGTTDYTSNSASVTLNNGTVRGNVYGGGKLGAVTGRTIVNINGGRVESNVFGGAMGEQGTILVAGLKTINMTGGTVIGNVYGGSQNANDANVLSNPSETELASTVFVNISGGRVVKNVYGGGFFGNISGSVTVNIGENAIVNAPDASANANKLSSLSHATAVQIEGSVYVGSDWGEISSGQSFGDPNISGYSNIYIDGTGYDMQQPLTGNFMVVSGSVYGAGTSSDAGKQGRSIYIRNYGLPVGSGDALEGCTRSLYSIQRADSLFLENAHITFLGQGDMTSLVTTERLSIVNVFEDMRLTQGSTVDVNSPINNLRKLQSLSIVNGKTLYNALPGDYDPVNYDELSTNGQGNRFRVNLGGYINVKYPAAWAGDEINVWLYGELKGFFYMITSTHSSFAYARPKNAGSSACPGAYDNPYDGGFVSYDPTKNLYDESGTQVTSGGVQIPFTNQVPTSKDDVQYYRFWKFIEEGDNAREAVLVAKSDGKNEKHYQYTSSTVELPASTGCYFKVRSIDWGLDAAGIDAAFMRNNEETWSYWNDDEHVLYEHLDTLNGQGAYIPAQLRYIDASPNTVFGLAVRGEGCLVAGVQESTNSWETPDDPSTVNERYALIVSNNTTTEHLASRRFYVNKNHLTETPKLEFMLTYSNRVDKNAILSSVHIIVDEYNCDDDEHPISSTDVEVIINTATVIDQDFTVPGYALMYGKGENGDVYNAKVVLPTFQLQPGSEERFSTFKITNIVTNLTLDGEAVTVHPVEWFDDHEGGVKDLAVRYGASLTFDNTQGWLTGYEIEHPENSLHDVAKFGTEGPVELGTADGRQNFGLALDLIYNGRLNISPKDNFLGTITFTVEFNNYEEGVEWSSFDITYKITERGAAVNWYIDGQAGKNLNSGKFPNDAKKSLSGVFNSPTYAPSDNIFIVNTIEINDKFGTEWNGLTYGANNVILYRYPGGHQEKDNTTGEGVLDPFNGTMVVVNKDFTMRGITLDGMNEYNGQYHELLNPDFYHTLGEGQHGFTITPTAPIIELKDGVSAFFYQSRVRNNLNNNGGTAGILINEGSALSLFDQSSVTGNRNGYGIDLDGTLNVSGKVTIENNLTDGKNTNIDIDDDDNRVMIDYSKNGLAEGAHIGITKSIPEGEGFTPIAYSELEQRAEEAYLNGYFFDDQGIYAVVYIPTDENLGPNTLYFGKTWVTVVTSEPTGFALDNIDSDEDLAWVISMVNGFNGQTANPNLNVTITEDLNMSRYIWVPIGNSTHKFSGVFDGGGHQVNGLVCSMSGLGAVGLLGYVDGANAEVKNVFAMDATLEAPDQNYMGSIAGVVSGGATVHSCEGALDLHTSNVNTVMGGLVGLLDGGNVHSCISAANLNGYLMGGLVGQTRNNASIKNSYAYAGVTYKGAGGHHIAGMVADNEGTVESCYIRLRDSYDLNEESFFVLADKNGGTVSQCYYADGVTEDYGLYNTGNAPSNCDVYFPGTHPYTYNENYNRVGNKTTGDYLLDILNDYAETNDMDTWFRSASDLNEDLPLLRFPNLASVSNVAGSPKFYYLNSLQAAFDKFGTETTNNVYVDVYGNSDVETTGSNTSSSKIKLAINEDAAVLQSDGSTLVASVGITLDNSAGSEGANPTNGDPDAIDWHMFSTSLSNAPLGINYTDNDQHDWWTQGHHADYSFYPDNSSYSGYFPGNTPVAQYDFYCYYEPQYHWINFKRNGNSHWHEDPNEEDQHEWIDYQYTPNGGSLVHGRDSNNEPEFIRGKGYLISVNDETFLQATGTLNNGTVTYPDVTASSDKCHGLNLIGNPYQSYLDFKEFAVGNSGSGKIWSAPENAFYTLIDEDMKGYVTYHYDASWNEGGITASRYINMHQGFFVVTQGNATATFTNAMRNGKGCNTTFRGDDEEMPRFPLVNLILNEQNGNRDYTVIELGRPEAGGAKKIKTLRIGKAQIYAHYENEDYAIAFTKTGESSIPVRFSTDENATFTLNWNTQNGTFSYLHLFDNMTGMDIDCLATDEYVFTATPDDYESRFKLVFAYTGIDENEIEMPDSFAFFNGDELIVNGEGRLECIDLQGRRLFVTDVYGTQNHVTLPDYASGLYLLHLSNGKQTKVQKIVVK